MLTASSSWAVAVPAFSNCWIHWTLLSQLTEVAELRPPFHWPTWSTCAALPAGAETMFRFAVAFEPASTVATAICSPPAQFAPDAVWVVDGDCVCCWMTTWVASRWSNASASASMVFSLADGAAADAPGAIEIERIDHRDLGGGRCLLVDGEDLARVGALKAGLLVERLARDQLGSRECVRRRDVLLRDRPDVVRRGGCRAGARRLGAGRVGGRGLDGRLGGYPGAPVPRPRPRPVAVARLLLRPGHGLPVRGRPGPRPREHSSSALADGTAGLVARRGRGAACGRPGPVPVSPRGGSDIAGSRAHRRRAVRGPGPVPVPVGARS